MSEPSDYCRIVAIPWYDHNKTYINISVGFSCYIDIYVYAKELWAKVKRAISRKQLHFDVCGSAVNAATYLEWEMRPAEAFINVCWKKN